VFASIQTRLSQFPSRVARFVVGLRDIAEVEDKLRDEMDAEIGDINSGLFLEDCLDLIIAQLPFDEETQRLFPARDFEGQDRAALLQLIGRVAREAVRMLEVGHYIIF